MEALVNVPVKTTFQLFISSRQKNKTAYGQVLYFHVSSISINFTCQWEMTKAGHKSHHLFPLSQMRSLCLCIYNSKGRHLGPYAT